jgi:hypothetical protein
MTTKFHPIQLSDNYRLNSDGAQYVLEERHVVDPTKGPMWQRRVDEAVAEGKPEPVAKIREEWGGGKDYERYYPLTYRGLAAAVEYVAIRAVTTADRMTFAEYLAVIRRESDRILGVVSPSVPKNNEEGA